MLDACGYEVVGKAGLNGAGGTVDGGGRAGREGCGGADVVDWEDLIPGGGG
jgi:hypothetical protein